MPSRSESARPSVVLPLAGGPVTTTMRVAGCSVLAIVRSRCHDLEGGFAALPRCHRVQSSLRATRERVLLTQGAAVAVDNGAGLVAGGDLLAHLQQRAGVPTDQLERVGILRAGMLTHDREGLPVYRVGGSRITELEGDVPKTALQIRDRSAASAQDSDVAIEGRLIRDAGCLELAEPLQGQAEAVAQGQGQWIVRADGVGAGGIQPAERTGHPLRDRSRLLLVAHVVERLGQPDQAVEGAHIL